MQSKRSNGKYHIMMTVLVVSWGLEYAVAKDALNSIDSITLITIKYFLGSAVMAVILLATSQFRRINKRDIPTFILCAIFGQIMYFFCEYNAMKTIPVAIITVLLGFVPVMSVIVERFLYKHRASRFLVAGMLVCIFGIVLAIGADFSMLSGGKVVGYLFCMGAMLAWVCYNFITNSVCSKYSSTCVAFYQMIIAALLTLPYSIFHLPDPSIFTGKIVMELLYLGVISAGLGFLIEVIGIQKLGPTPVGVYSNFMPVTTAFFGVILLGQHLTLLQYLGGAIVIVSGCLVIREKARLDIQREKGSL
ncbi:MAG: DMT family transporter [Eubacteriaceae bacterium]|nr:DMT family transporter [Eubacteriaceae bacterium]